VWQPILRGIILNTRPKKSAKAYSKVWLGDGSPLAVITRDQAAGLQARLGDCDRILLAPLYPQYCAATTATVVDKAAETLAKQRWQASLRTLPPYHDDPAYIDALAKDIARQLTTLEFKPLPQDGAALG